MGRQGTGTVLSYLSVAALSQLLLGIAVSKAFVPHCLGLQETQVRSLSGASTEFPALGTKFNLPSFWATELYCAQNLFQKLSNHIGLFGISCITNASLELDHYYS